MSTADILKLKDNAHLQWCLKRLTERDRTAPNPKYLSIMQNPMCYYACLAAKRHEAMNTAERNRRATVTYKDLAVKGWLQWLSEVADFRPPQWITAELMGKSTLRGGDSKLYDPKQEVVWRRYAEAGREIRSTFNIIVDKYTVAGDELPSGTQAGDLQHHLHEQLWRQSSHSKRKMKRANLEALRAEGRHFDVVREEQGGKDDNAAAATGDVEEGSSAMEPPITSPQSSEEAETQACRATADEDSVTVYVPMPDHWLHPHSLVYCLFGSVAGAGYQDPDLNLSTTSGPPNRKRKSAEAITDCDADVESGTDSSMTSPSSNLSKRALKMMKGAGVSHSRAEARKSARQEQIEVYEDLKPKMQNTTQEDPDTKELVRCIKKMMNDNSARAAAAEARIAAADARAVREAEIARLKEEIALLLELGEKDEARDVRKKLLALVKAPLPVAKPAGGVGVDAASTAAPTDETEPEAPLDVPADVGMPYGLPGANGADTADEEAVGGYSVSSYNTESREGEFLAQMNKRQICYDGQSPPSVDPSDGEGEGNEDEGEIVIG